MTEVVQAPPLIWHTLQHGLCDSWARPTFFTLEHFARQRSSAITEKSRCRVDYAKSGRLELGDNIYGHYRSIFNHCDVHVFGHQSNGIRWKTQNKGYYAVQSHSRSWRSVLIESPYATSYWWLIVTDNLSRTIAELSQLIVQILDTAFWTTLWGRRNNVRCSSWAHLKARSGLPISDNWTFSLDVTVEALRAKIDRKSAISLQRD